MRLLVTGVSGLLGHHVAAQALQAGWQVLGITGRLASPLPIETLSLDLTEASSALEACLRRFQPDVVIHCAAWSEASQCERDPEKAQRINVEATETLARLARARFLFLSTDLVFDGSAAPYDEASPTCPLGWYGRTKVMAEQLLLPLPNTLSVRTSLLFGPSPAGTRSAEERLAALVASGQRPKLFTDERRSPIHAADLAAALLELAGQPVTGLMHLGGPECLSRFEIGQLLARHYGWPAEQLQPARTSDFDGPPRPKNVCLDSSRAFALLKHRPQPLVAHFPP